MRKLYFLFFLAFLPLVASAQAVEIDGIYYNLNSSGDTKTAEVTQNPNRYSGDIVIPETVTYNDVTYSVTSIGDYAFTSCSGLTSVTIPNSLTSIGDYAFMACSGLTSVIIPNSVTSIGFSAFFYCSSLLSITIPNSVNFIGASAFQGTAWYNNKPDGLVYAGKVAYKYKGEMPVNTAIILENGTLGISPYAFSGCSGMTSVAIPNSVTSIGFNAFSDCTSLTSVTIPNSVTSIGNMAFHNCSGMTSVIISNSVTSIGSGAFSDCTSLTSVTIPNSVTSIGDTAFYGCSSLTSVTIPNSVNSIGASAFQGTAWYNNQPDGLVYAGKVAYYYKGKMPVNTAITLESGTLGIAKYAFSGCSGLTSVTIPNSVISVGLSPFENCSELTSVVVESDNPVYDSRDNCNAIIETSTNTLIAGCKKSIIPISVISIGNSAFHFCKGLTSITIPKNVTSIGERAFTTNMLVSLIVESENTVYDSRDNCNAIIETSTNTLIVGCQNTKIPNSVVHIGSDAFYNCNGLKNIIIPEGVKTIDRNAFSSCFGLEGVELPSSLTNIGYAAFRQCTKMKTVISYITNPGGVLSSNDVFDSSSATLYVPQSSIDAYKATERWSSFKNILPLEDMLANIEFADAKVKEICVANWDTNGDGELSKLEASMVSDLGNVFRYKYELRSFHELKYFTGLISISGFAFSGINDFSVTIPENVKDIDFFDWHPRIVEVVENNPYLKFVDGVLYNNDLTILYYCTEDGDKQEFEIPNSVKRISSGAFNGRKMTSVTIPQSVTDIWAEAFWGCSSLTTIFIPNSVTYIGTGVFGGCKNLTSIIVEKDNPVYDSRDNCNAIIKTSDNTLIQGCSTTVIPQDVTTIGDYAFWGINSLKHIEIPPSVLSIGSWAFTGTGLTSVIIPKTVTSISDSFMASKLKSVIVEHKVPLNINKSAFNALDNSPVLYVPAGSKAAYESADVWKDFAEIIEYDGLESVTIGKSGKASYCGDKSLDFSFSDEIKAYIATGFDKDEEIIWLTRVKDVPAGTPVLIKGEANKTYDVPVTDSENSYYTNMFKGNISGATVQVNETDGDMVNYYLSGDGTFKSVKGYVNIGNNKSYLQLPGTFAPAEAGTTQTVKVGSAGKASFAAPVDLDFTNVEGLKAFTATGYDKSSKTIWLTRVMKVQKGEGVLLKGDAKDYEIPSVAVQSSYMNMFVGNTSGDKIQVQSTSDDGSQTNFYLKGDGTFVSVNGYVNIGNNKCYLELPTSMVSTAASTRAEASYLLDEPEVIKLPILYRSLDSEGNGTTAIKEVKSGEVKGEKWFTLQGQRVENHGKGIYIKNGKKIIVK